jgi:hypothetical protein
MSGGMIIFLEIIAPLVALIAYGRIKIAMARRKAEAEDAPAVAVKLPFEPKPEPTPGLLLRLFSTPQRAYLRQQIALAKGCFYIVGWVSLVLFTAGLLPQYVNEYGLEQPLAQRVWYSYLNHVTLSEFWFAFAALGGALIALSALTTDAPAIFNRTRPLTRSFLFWARVLPAIATVLAAIAMGAVVSLLLLLVFYGPVWLHLLDALQAPNGSLLMQGLTAQQSTHLVHLLLTSAPRIFLSMTTTAILVFAVFAAMIAQPFNILQKRSSKFATVPFAFVGSFMGIAIIHIVHGANFLRVSHATFVYLSLGPPPPYMYVLLPLAASALLLYLAQLLVARKEL